MKDSCDKSANIAQQHLPPLTPQEQREQLAALLLAGAKRLATDPQRLAEIKKLLF